MKTIEDYKTEYYRVAKLHKGYVSSAAYLKYCKKGYSLSYIKRDLKMTWREFLLNIGAPIWVAKTAHSNIKNRSSSIFCLRMDRKIKDKECCPNKPVCYTCPDKQKNSKGSNDNISDDRETHSSNAGFDHIYLENV